MLPPGLLKSDIIHEEWDQFWEKDISLIENCTPRPVLVLTTPFEAGSAEELQLGKMLQACKIADDTINIIKMPSTSKVPWYIFKDGLQAEVVLLLSIQPAQLGISALFKINEPNHFDKCVFLPTMSIAELEQYPDMKKQLWNNGLKPLFVDKTIAIN